MTQTTVRKAPFAKCEQCPLVHAQFVPSDPVKPDAKYTIVGESPGSTEAAAAAEGKPESSFIGASGSLLWGTLRKHKLTRADFDVTNAVLCQPPTGEDKEAILSAAAVCCDARLRKELSKRANPVLLLGKTAREAFAGTPGIHEDYQTLNGRWMNLYFNVPLTKAEKEQYSQIVGQEKQMLATLHPAYVLRDPDNAKTMIEDIAKFVEKKSALSRADPSRIQRIIVDVESLPTVLSTLAWKTALAFDIESEALDFINDKILMLQIYDGNVVYIFPGLHPQSPGDVIYEHKCQAVWKDFWTNYKGVFVGHNGKFDARFLIYQLNWPVRVDFDVMLAHYCFDERKGTHSLKTLGARILDIPDWEASIKQYVPHKKDKYNQIPWDVLVVYAAIDVIATLNLYWYFANKFQRSPAQKDLFYNILMPFASVLMKAEIRGVPVDTEYLSAVWTQLEDEMTEIENRIRTISGGVVDNMNSNPQKSNYIYNVLGLPRPRGRKIKATSVSKEALAQLKGVHPVIADFVKYGRIAKLFSSYVKNTMGMVDDDGRVHCDNQIIGTEVGRISVKDPALQTIPRADDREEGQYGTMVKNMFVAPPGRVLLVCDYSQAELRVAAALSGEPFLLDVYLHDRDLHGEVAISMYGSNFSKQQRVLCKMFNFSYLYGGNEWSFAQDAGLPIEVAREFVRNYDKMMPVLSAWKQSKVEEMTQKGYVTFRTGRRRRIPYINAVNREEARKSSFHAVVAGSASDLTSMSAVEVNKYLTVHPGMGDLLLLVHDSIICEVAIEHVHEVADYVQAVMQATGETWFPEVVWKADAEVGERWGSTIKLEKWHVPEKTS